MAAPPELSRDAARMLIHNAKEVIRPNRAFCHSKIHALKDCFGHVVGRFGYFLLVHILSKHADIRLTPKDLLIPIVIDAFAHCLAQNEAITAKNRSRLF
jgi:hypothetical protein